MKETAFIPSLNSLAIIIMYKTDVGVIIIIVVVVAIVVVVVIV